MTAKPAPAARAQKIRLGDLLIQAGLLSASQLEAALAKQRQTGRKLGRILVESGLVTDEDIARAIGRQLALPFMDLKQRDLDPELVKRLSESQARRFRALVLDQTETGFQVGLVDPADLHAYDEISRLLRCKVQLAVVAESQFFAMADRMYRRTEEISGLARELTADLGETSVEFDDPQGGAVSSEDAPVVRLLHTLFDEAIKSRASDIHIEPQQSCLRIRFRIDGVLHVQTETEAKIAASVVLRLKIMANLDISEKRLCQDGRFHVKVHHAPIDVRMSTLPTQHGESVVMRLLNQSAGLTSLERLGLPERVLERLQHAIHRPNGMVLVTGPTGSGKTTTLYAALAEINTTGKKIITAEDPVEYRLPGLNQVQINDKIGFSFAHILRTSLRQDPDIILVGEMRDQETAEIGMRAAMTGHLVLSTLHTNNAASTPVRLLDMGVPHFMVSQSLRLVMAQRLVRRICDACAEPHAPACNELEFLRAELGEWTSDRPLLHGRGCKRCNGTGYQGRTGVYEFLEMTQELADAAADPEPGAFLRAAHRQMAGETLRRDAARLAARGVTTIDEAMGLSTHYEE